MMLKTYCLEYADVGNISRHTKRTNMYMRQSVI